MTEEQARKLEDQSMIGKTIRFKVKGGTERVDWRVVEDEVYVMVADYKHLLQRVKRDGGFGDGSEYGYRTAYYTWDATGTQIKWGQYTQFLTEKEYTVLLAKAKEKGSVKTFV